MITVDFERARTWFVEIAAALVPDPHWVIDGNEHKLLGTSGLSINTQKGAWHIHGTGRGGYSPIGLVQALRPGYSIKDVAVWLDGFLLQHPGTGPGAVDAGGEDDVDDDPASAAAARALLAREVRVGGTPAEAYLRGRSLPPPYSNDLSYCEHCRSGEGGLVAKLRANDRVVAVQVTHLTPDGAKSLVVPQRRRLNLERSADAAFVIQPPADRAGTVDLRGADIIFAEGLEDGLSLALLRQSASIFALPGIGVLKNVTVPAGKRVRVVRDGDPEGSIPDKALKAGLDNLLQQTEAVTVTNTPIGMDANAALQQGGTAGLLQLFNNVRTPKLSSDAALQQKARELAGLSRAEYDAARREAAKAIGVRLGTLDAAVQKLRPKSTTPDDDKSEDADPVVEDPPWTSSIDIRAALDAAVERMPRFLVAPAYYLHLIALWSVVTHLTQSEDVALAIVPQLGFVSLGPDAGKSVALEIAATLAYRGKLRSSFTAATLFRRISAEQVTYFLNELDNNLTNHTPELRAVINACHRRSEAVVDRTETDAKGRRYVVAYRCWAALGWGSIGYPASEVMSRSITLEMRSALPEESAKLNHTAPSRCSVFIDARRHFAAWAATIKRLPDPKLPTSVFNRIADNFRPLASVAQLAGGDWPQRVLTAIEEIGKAEKKPSQLVRLLGDIRDILADAPNNRLPSADLIEKLCDDEETGWCEANHNKRITAYWLREALRGHLDPAGSQKWSEGTDDARVHFRGYELHQFEDAFLRHLNIFSQTPKTSAASATSAADTKTSSNPKGPTAADQAVHPPPHPPRKSASKSDGLSGSAADATDAADQKRGARRKRAKADSAVPPIPPGEAPLEQVWNQPPAEAEPASPATGATNGLDQKVDGEASADPTPRPTRKRSKTEDAIKETALLHPDWSDKEIGRHCARSASVVRRILGREAHTLTPSKPNGKGGAS